MKKCSSCTKDLPDAALHCVFCGAKQPPAPAAQPGMAKTVMGYGNNEELNRLREQAAAQNAARSNSPSSAPPMAQPQAPAPSPYNAPRPQSASQPPPAGYGQGALAPTAGAQARTMFVDGPPPNAPRSNSPSSQPLGPSVPGGMPLGGPSPMANVKTLAPEPARVAAMSPSPHGPGPSMGGPAGYNPQPVGSYNPQPVGGYNPQPVSQPAPQAALPSATPPYMAPSHNANQAARPIDPFKDTLRTMMFIWGGVLIACFAVPISLSPLAGWWNVVADAPGTAKLVPLLLAAVGVLSLVVGAIPMATGPRGMIAAVLGLAGLLVPIFLAEAMPEWKAFLSVGGTILLVPALLVRNEYTESPLPRILVTIGALCALAPFVIPENGRIPLVDLFSILVDAPGAAKVLFGLFVVYALILVLSLLAWLPSPATAGAKVLAWVLVLFPLILTGAGIALSGGEGIDFEHKLNPTVLGWAYGLGGGAGGGIALGGMMLGSAYLALSSYGLASVIGKKLE